MAHLPYLIDLELHCFIFFCFCDRPVLVIASGFRSAVRQAFPASGKDSASSSIGWRNPRQLSNALYVVMTGSNVGMVFVSQIGGNKRSDAEKESAVPWNYSNRFSNNIRYALAHAPMPSGASLTLSLASPEPVQYLNNQLSSQFFFAWSANLPHHIPPPPSNYSSLGSFFSLSLSLWIIMKLYKNFTSSPNFSRVAIRSGRPPGAKILLRRARPRQRRWVSPHVNRGRQPHCPFIVLMQSNPSSRSISRFPYLPRKSITTPTFSRYVKAPVSESPRSMRLAVAKPRGGAVRLPDRIRRPHCSQGRLSRGPKREFVRNNTID